MLDVECLMLDDGCFKNYSLLITYYLLFLQNAKAIHHKFPRKTHRPFLPENHGDS